MDILKLDIKLIDGGMIPEYKTEGSVGADCFARLDKPFDLYPNTRAKIPLGFAVSLPAGFEMQIRGRSGLAYKKGIVCYLGTIDMDYTGEVCAILFNKGREVFHIENKDRIAQAVVAPIVQVGFNQIQELKQTERGNGGFGHTGIKG